jgi:RecG-like helicase
MSTEEKERIMFDFRTGEIHILVATTIGCRPPGGKV